MFFLVNPASYSSPRLKMNDYTFFLQNVSFTCRPCFWFLFHPSDISPQTGWRSKMCAVHRSSSFSYRPFINILLFRLLSHPYRPPFPLVFPTPCPTFSHVQSVKSIHTNSLWRSLLFFNVHGDKTQVKNISLSRKLLYLLWNFEVGVQRRILKSIDNFFSRKCLNIMNINHTFLATGP